VVLFTNLLLTLILIHRKKLLVHRIEALFCHYYKTNSNYNCRNDLFSVHWLKQDLGIRITVKTLIKQFFSIVGNAGIYCFLFLESKKLLISVCFEVKKLISFSWKIFKEKVWNLFSYLDWISSLIAMEINIFNIKIQKLKSWISKFLLH
jgi:hypothetical protein